MKKKKVIITFSIVLVCLIILFNFYFSEKSSEKEPTPISTGSVAPYYCKTLGYEWRIEETERGQHGICKFPDGTECGEWEFWGGECGEEWSYCEKNGYNQIIREDIADYFSPRGHITCVDKTTGEEIGLVFDLMSMRQQFESDPELLK